MAFIAVHSFTLFTAKKAPHFLICPIHAHVILPTFRELRSISGRHAVGFNEHSVDVGSLQCKVHSRIVDERSGYLQRDGEKYEFAKISLKDGRGHNIRTGSYRTHTWAVVVDQINYPTLRDTLWAIRSLLVDTLMNGEEKGTKEVYLGYKCQVPLRIHLWGSMITFAHTIPARGEYGLHNLQETHPPLDSPGPVGMTNLTNSTFNAASLPSHVGAALRQTVMA